MGSTPANSRYLIQPDFDFSSVQGRLPNQPQLSGPTLVHWEGWQILDLVIIELQEHSIFT